MWTEFKDFLKKNFNIELDDEKIDKFKKYLDEILKCSRKFNLTRITDRKQAIFLHFADSLACSFFIERAITKKQDISLVDIGSGAGFPGIPVKILYSEIGLVLVESNKKKSLFLDYIKNLLDLKNTKVICDRAEKVSKETEFKNKFDFVLARAVKKFPEILELSEPFLKNSGVALLWTTDKNEKISGEFFEYTLPGLNKKRYIIAIDSGQLLPNFS